MTTTIRRDLDRRDLPTDVSDPLADLTAAILDHGASRTQHDELAAFLPSLSGVRMGETFTDYLRAATAFTAAYVAQARTFTPEHVKHSDAFVMRDTVIDDDVRVATTMLDTCRTYLADPSVPNLAAIADAPTGFCDTEGLPYSVVNSLTDALARMASDALTNPLDHQETRHVLVNDLSTVACDNDTNLSALLTAVRDEFTA